MQGYFISGYYGIELENLEAQFFAFLHGIQHQVFTNMLTSYTLFDGIACITNMTATTYIVRVEDV